jgi:thymidylate synthase ThyX
MSDLATLARKHNPPREEVYSKDRDPKEEKEAKIAMEKFVSDAYGPIYAVKPIVPELFSSLLKARYSRTELSAKQLLWREFVSQKADIPWKQIEKGLDALDEVFNFKRGESVAERILLQYGDDSVFELGGAHLFLDRVSMVASKVIEDARIGISPLEKSTRYVVFDQKGPDGDYSFFKEPTIMESKHKELYLETSRTLFDFYAKTVQIFLEFFRKEIPLEKQKFPDMSNKNEPTIYKNLKDEKSIKAANVAYNASVRSKACDLARVLLPSSTLTNIGEYGNARAYGYLFTKMQAMPLAEMQMIGHEAVRELKKVLPKFFDVVDNPHGLAYQEYLRKTDEAMKAHAKRVLKNIKPNKVDMVELVKLDKDPEITIVAGLLYPFSTIPLQQLLKIVKSMAKKDRQKILKDSLKFRTNRRHKPPRAFELPGYELVFDILSDFGAFRDLHRQRILTQQRQFITTDHGYAMPPEFKNSGLDKEFKEVMEKTRVAHDKIAKDFPDEAQYVTAMAHNIRWYMGMNLREAFWLTELRSTPQGHVVYRTIAQNMFLKAMKTYPFLKELKEMNEHFVDFSDRSKNLERMEAMQKIQTKLAAIEEKYS